MSGVTLRRLVLVLAFLGVLLRPGYGDLPATQEVADLEVLVVVDRTRSMAALDGSAGGPRIEDAQRDVLALVEQLPDARFALVTFGNRNDYAIPFTTDLATFTDAVEGIRLEPAASGSGSRADRVLDVIDAVLWSADQQHPTRRRVVVFVGDGENTIEGRQKSFKPLAAAIDAGVVLGYGTVTGARMPASDDLSVTGNWVYDPLAATDAYSHADPDNLQTIADQMGADFVPRSDAAGGMDSVAAELTTAGGAGARSDRPAHDLTWLLGLLVLVLVLFELHTWWREMWDARDLLPDGDTDGDTDEGALR